MMPVHDTKVSCPNCGRTRVKPIDRRPSVYTDSTAFELSEAGKGTFFSSLAAAIAIAVCSLLFISMGLFMRSPLSLLWILLGVIGGGVAVYSFRDISQTFRLGGKPALGYIDHLRELEKSRIALREKIAELKVLIKRQHPRQSERAANRLKLVTSALKNRERKLELIDEAEFIIEAKRRISRISALAQDLAERRRPRETEKNIEAAFSEMKIWVKKLPTHFQSGAAKRVYESLLQAMELHADIMEQIEDRVVMRALDDGSGGTKSDDALALEEIRLFLDKSSIQSELDAYEIEEAIATDEEFIRINTELRLMKDGIKQDFTTDPFVDLDSHPESKDYPSGLS